MTQEQLTENKDWHVLEFFVPIQESMEDSGDFIIKGVAINETTTLNNVKYIAEELQKAAPSFRNVPILLDHKNEVKNIVGRTTENVKWSELNKRIEFEGRIMDKDIQEMIKDGRIGSVSIGAKVNDLVEEEDGSMKAIGIEGLELSLVAVPGDTHANLAQALEQSFVLKEKAKLHTDARIKIKREDANMAEEEKSEEAESEAEEAKEEAEEAPAEPEAPAEEPVEESKAEEVSETRKILNQIKEMLAVKQVKEAEAEEPEEAEDETKGEVATDEDSTEESAVVVERCGAGQFALYRDYSKESSDLKRLSR